MTNTSTNSGLLRELDREALHADHMAALAKYWMVRAQKAESELLTRTIALVSAAGGHVTVFCADLFDMPNKELCWYYQDYDMTAHFRVQDKKTAATNSGRGGGLRTAQKFSAYRRWLMLRDVAWVRGWGWTPAQIIMETGKDYWRG